MDKLDSLWIIDSKGLCLLHQAFNFSEQKIDRSMFSSFVSAILNFSDCFFDDCLEQISMGKLDVYFLPFKQGSFFVVIAAQRGANEDFILQKIREVGAAFESEYGDVLDHIIVNEEDFAPFIDTINKIFGIETVQIIPEHKQFLELLKVAEEFSYSENQTVEMVLDFFEKQPKNKRKILLQTALPTLSIFMQSDNLSHVQMKRFQQVLDFQKK